MAISFQCPHCACAYDLEDSCAGTTLKCRRCGHQIQAPGSVPLAPPKLAPGPADNLRHEEKKDMPLLSATPTRYLNQITRHIARTIGHSPMVFHEIVSTDIHLDLHIVPPQPGGATPEHPRGRDCYTIVTSGMSTRPLAAPADADPDGPRYAELLLTLPADWPGLRPDGTFVQEYMRDEANWWPIRWLKLIARMAHEYGACVGSGRTIPNGERAERYAENTGFGALLLLPSVLHPKADRLVVHDDMAIEFLALWPLYPAELEMALRDGAAALQAALAREGVSDLIDIRRKNVARSR